MNSFTAAKALRVLFATDHIHFPQGGGGGERNTHELCLGLRNYGICPAVMSSISADMSWLSWSNRVRRKLPPRPQYPLDQRCGYPVFRGWAEDGAREVYSRFRPHVVVIQSTDPEKLLQAFAQFDLPMFVYLHEVVKIDHLASIKKFKVKILTNSPFASARLKTACDLDSTVILPLIEPSFYKTNSKRERVLFVNTVPRKGLEIALAIAAARPDIKFDFVSSWILRGDELLELRARVGVHANVMLHAPTRDMRKLYANAKILLTPSLCEETWGRVVTEAHISGIPVIASDRGGLPMAVGPGGCIVPAEAPVSQWVSALSALWDNPVYYGNLSAKSLEYSRRREIQPENILSTFAETIEKDVKSRMDARICRGH